ncbi:hypothetical protein BDM02DRAFT_3130630 [Thelephora ganbajun]|uniref:Uncharacterized protein n=1 Tax=Thelephora ganbajun TaxID=370292 RepID=A0ACB6Z994_THEGA|nr:hypothetical protein BDM02DRAFT_3130630 [Thelephora ganbajun]
MAEPIETLTQQLIRRATDPFGLAILTGMASSSFWLFGSLGISIDGAFPAIVTESERAKKGISDASALKLWEWVFHRAKKHFAALALLSGASYLVASAFRPDLRPILYGASFLSFSALPYTLVTLMPINNEILKIASDASKHDGKSPEPGLVDELFSEWSKYNSIRIGIATVAWGLGTAALLLA